MNDSYNEIENAINVAAKNSEPYWIFSHLETRAYSARRNKDITWGEWSALSGKIAVIRSEFWDERDYEEECGR